MFAWGAGGVRNWGLWSREEVGERREPKELQASSGACILGWTNWVMAARSCSSEWSKLRASLAGGQLGSTLGNKQIDAK